MSSSSPSISPETAAHVLFHYGRGGYQAGSFTESLIKTIDLADADHRDLLAISFPGLVAAVVAIKYDRDGVDQLTAIARGEVAA